jgi:hypothetical protein
VWFDVTDSFAAQRSRSARLRFCSVLLMMPFLKVSAIVHAPGVLSQGVNQCSCLLVWILQFTHVAPCIALQRAHHVCCVRHSSLRRIVGLTADTTSRVTQACRDAGMSDVLFKPTTASAMMLFLSSVVRSPEPAQSCSEQAPAHTGATVPLPKTEVRPSIVAQYSANSAAVVKL